MTAPMPAGSRFLLPVLLLVAMLAFAIAGESATLLLRYDRAAILDGELWRLLSGHLVHLGWGHTLMNALAAVLIFGLFGRDLDMTGWILATVASALAIDLGLLWLSPEVDWYVGLSGVLHGFIAAGSVALLLRGQRMAGGVLVLLLAKVVWEQLHGPLPGSEESAGGPVLVVAHLYGTLGGLLSGLCVWRSPENIRH